MGGDVEVESTPGEGTTFRFEIVADLDVESGEEAFGVGGG
jgi:signal transduction histidine kinase